MSSLCRLTLHRNAASTVIGMHISQCDHLIDAGRPWRENIARGKRDQWKEVHNTGEVGSVCALNLEQQSA